MRKIIILFASLLCFACSKQDDGGPKKFLIGSTDANGNYTIQEVTLTTLDSPLEMKGAAAEVYMKSPLTDAGYQGSIARPHFTLIGDVYVPRDPDSSLAVGVYSEMENLYNYDRTLGVADQVAWPRKIGVELNVVNESGSMHDNAIYIPSSDVMAVLPYSGGGVPIALNHGVLGHEHFHAHFQSQVMNRLDPAFSKSISFVYRMFYPILNAFSVSGGGSDWATVNPNGGTLADSKQFQNTVVLRGWNEGLADLNGAIFTGKADFFEDSLPQLTPFRSLANPISRLLDAGLFSFKLESVDPVHLNEFAVGTAYDQGSQVARALFILANSGSEPPQSFMTRILRNIGSIPAVIDPGISTSTMDFESVLPILLQGYTLNKVSCDALRSLVSASSTLISDRFSQCSSL